MPVPLGSLHDLLSPDGHALRFTIIHQGDPLTEAGTARIDALKIAAEDAVKGTPLAGSSIYLGGSAALYKDMQHGADYNLLLVSRMKEELHAGVRTGIIRSMAGTGSVVTAAGMVFAFTMISMTVSDMIVIGQVGTTIGLGLLFDTFVVRSFMTPSIAALLGRWFWWPQHIRMRPRPQPWPAASGVDTAVLAAKLE